VASVGMWIQGKGRQLGNTHVLWVNGRPWQKNGGGMGEKGAERMREGGREEGIAKGGACSLAAAM
jgi:hypothetical protein